MELRSPDDVGHFAVVGLLFLPLGFALQACGYVDVSIDASERASLVAGVIALAGGALFAWLIYGVTYLVAERREVTRIEEETPGETYPRRTLRLGIRF
jgi:hypothetical protein